MDLATRLFRVRRTCLQMLNDRGYLVSEVRGERREKRLTLDFPPPLLSRPRSQPALHLSISQDDLNTTLDAFRDRWGDAPARDDLTILAPKQDDPTDQVFVFFSGTADEPKVGVKQIKNLAERMRAESVFRAIVVAQVAMTPFARQCLTEMAPKYTIEVVS